MSIYHTYYDPDANWTLIPVHMRPGVIRYVMDGIRPGGFMQAILANDFMDAAGRADEDNLAALSGWARFLYNYVPSQSKGSRQAVDTWIKSGGVNGQRRALAADAAETSQT